MSHLPIPVHEQRLAPHARVSGWPPVSLIWMARVEVGQPSGWPAHLHAGAELLLVERGAWMGSVDRRDLRVSAGDALLVLPGDLHQDHMREAVDYFGFLFAWSPDLVPNAATVPRILPNFSTHMLGVARRLWDCLRERDNPASQREATLLAASVITALLNEIDILPPLPAGGDLLRRLQAMVRSDPSAVPSMETLARFLGTSERTLRRNCQRDYGVAPLTLLRRVRLDVADEWLRGSPTPLADIASQLGFASAAHFSRLYHQRFGVPPSTVRNPE